MTTDEKVSVLIESQIVLLRAQANQSIAISRSGEISITNPLYFTLQFQDPEVLKAEADKLEAMLQKPSTEREGGE